MRTSLSIVFVSGIVAGVASLVACGSGTVGTYSYEQAYEGHPGDFTRPTESNQQRAGSRQASSSSSGSASPSTGSSGSPGDDDSSGSSGSPGAPSAFDAGSSGSSGATTTDCSVCGATYQCTANANGQTADGTLTLGEVSNDSCAIAETEGALVTCDGRVTSNGTDVGTWTASGNTFVVVLSGSGSTVTYNCTRQ